MHVIGKWILLGTGIGLFASSWFGFPAALEQIISVFSSLTISGGAPSITMDPLPIVQFVALLLFGLILLGNGYVSPAESLATAWKRWKKHVPATVPPSASPSRVFTFTSFSFARMAISIAVVLAGFGWIWPSTSGLRFGFFTESFELIPFGVEHALLPLPVFYFAGLPFILIGVILFLQTLFSLQAYKISIFGDKIDVRAYLFLPDKEVIEKNRVTFAQAGPERSRYKWFVTGLVMLLSLNVHIGWSINDAIIRPELSQLLLTSGVVVLACMIVLAIIPRMTLRFQVTTPAGSGAEMFTFKVTPLLKPSAWRAMVDALGISPPRNTKDASEEPGKDRKVGPLMDIITGCIFLLFGIASQRNTTIVLGVGIDAAFIIFGIRLVGKWLQDAPLKETITKNPSGFVIMTQKTIFGYRNTQLAATSEMILGRRFKVPNIFDSMAMIFIAASVTWYMTRSWFPRFSYFETTPQYWMSGVVVLLLLAWRLLATRPTVTFGSRALYLEKGTSSPLRLNKRFFKEIPIRLVAYFKKIDDPGLRRSFWLQLATFIMLISAPLILASLGFAILMEGYPLYIMVSISVGWSAFSFFYGFREKARTRNP